MTENFRPTVLRNHALDALKGKWGTVVTPGIIYIIIGIIPFFWIDSAIWLVYLFNWLIVAPLGVGLYFLFWDVLKGKEVNLQTMFEAFAKYGQYITLLLLVFIYIFLWSLLLIVPGMIKGLSYAMSYYIMRENPDMSREQVICRSMKMMEGHKMDLFLLSLSFIGWSLLSILTLGIGLIWLIPYMLTAYAAFYDTLKKEYEAKTAVA